MIYVIAAYSITIGTLAIYGVLMQHRGRMHLSEMAGATDQSATDATPSGFNLGAALLTPFWMWMHGMRVAGLILFFFYLAMAPLYDLAMWAPLFIAAIVAGAVGVALGVVGNRIASSHRASATAAEFARGQLPWALAGVGVFTILAPWLWYFLLAEAS